MISREVGLYFPGIVKAGLYYLASSTQKAEAVFVLGSQSLTLFWGGVMRGMREPHPFCESSVLKE